MMTTMFKICKTRRCESQCPTAGSSKIACNKVSLITMCDSCVQYKSRQLMLQTATVLQLRTLLHFKTKSNIGNKEIRTKRTSFSLLRVLFRSFIFSVGISDEFFFSTLLPSLSRAKTQFLTPKMVLRAPGTLTCLSKALLASLGSDGL